MPAAVKLSPAAFVIMKLGIRPLARELDVDPTTVLRWRSGDGLVPSQYHVRVLQIAREHRVKITEHDLIHGREA